MSGKQIRINSAELKRRIMDKKWTAKEAATRIGVTQPTMYRLMKKDDFISMMTAAKLREVFGDNDNGDGLFFWNVDDNGRKSGNITAEWEKDDRPTFTVKQGTKQIYRFCAGSTKAEHQREEQAALDKAKADGLIFTGIIPVEPYTEDGIYKTILCFVPASALVRVAEDSDD